MSTTSAPTSTSTTTTAPPTPTTAGLFAVQRSAVLPLLRIFVCAVLATRGDGATMVRALRIPASLFHVPTIDALGLPFPPPTTTATAMAVALKICAVLAMLGVLTRVSLLATFALLLYVGAINSGYGFFNHTPALAAQLLLALAIVPGSTGLSVDRLVVGLVKVRRERRAFAWSTWPRAIEWLPSAPRFGEQLVLLAIGLLYFAAGVAKLRFGGVAWLTGETLREYLLGVDYNGWHATVSGGDDVVIHRYAYRSADWAAFLARIPGVPFILAIFATLFELGAPLLLLGVFARTAAGVAKGRAIFVGCALAFHVGIRVTLGPGFDIWIAAALAVFPWIDAYRWARPRFDAWRARRRPASSATPSTTTSPRS